MHPFLIVAAASAAVMVPLWLAMTFDLRKQGESGRKHQEWQRTASAGELAGDIADTLRSWKWDRFPSGVAILTHTGSWTDQELLSLVETLFTEAIAEDHALNRHGRESNSFDYHDCGLVSLAELLRHRLRNQPP